ncbi:MAG: PorV/PorQ family protein [Calditrichaeota bacterium]|nr:PorV/PorQ family protein [Calditrichota bacterium]
MLRNIFRISFGALMVLLMVNAMALAGGRSRAGTSSAPQLLIPVGARYIALGGASAANAEGVEAMYWNPAGLARSTHNAEAMFSHMTYLADISVDYLGVGLNFGKLGFVGFNLKALGLGDIMVTTADNPDGTGEKFTPTYFTLGLTYARMLTDHVTVGVNAKIISEQIPRASSVGFAMDAGVQYAGLGGVKGLNVGVTIKNIGPDMTYDGTGLYRKAKAVGSKRPVSDLKVAPATFELPSIVEIALSYEYSLGQLGLIRASYLFQNNNFSADENKAGIEYSLKNMFFLRAGYTSALNAPTNSYIYGPAFGFGYHQNLGGMDLYIDYAYRTVEYFNANQILSIKLGL